jgi:D-glucosaminate-specific PTS system IID component
MSDVTTKKLISKKELFIHWLRYMFMGDVINSYERFQAVNFAWALGPILKKLYPEKKDFASALTRHCLPLYNCNANWGTAINGVVIAMEEKRSQGAEIAEEAIVGIKTGLMGPLSGVGDTIDFGTLRILIFSAGAVASAGGSLIGIPIMFLLPIINYLTSWYLLKLGYSLGAKAISSMLKSGVIGELIAGASLIGIFMMGSLTAQLVNLTTPVTFSSTQGVSVQLQGVLDAILPGVLPLAVTWGIFMYFHSGKNRNFTVVVLVMLAVCVLGSLVGVL